MTGSLIRLKKGMRLRFATTFNRLRDCCRKKNKSSYASKVRRIFERPLRLIVFFTSQFWYGEFDKEVVS